MARTWLLAAALLMLALSATSASADPARGYVPYDGWARGEDAYHGFAWRDPAIGGENARRPDFSKWSGFDQYPLRLSYPLYRAPWGCSYVWPERKDVHLTACGIPEISELCCHRCHRRHHHGQCCDEHGHYPASGPTEFDRWTKANIPGTNQHYSW